MLAHFKTAIGWKELLTRTVRETFGDDGLGLAAQLAYYFFLALFPALLCVIALASLFPLESLIDDVTRALAPIAPPEMVAIIHQQMQRISQGDNAGLFSLGLLGAIWASSSAMIAVVQAMNRAYDIEETRPWWKVRLTAILLTVGLAFFILVSFTLVVAGPEIAEALARRLGLGSAFVVAWKILQWPVAFALVATAIGIIYAFAPDAEQDWVWFTPGSVLATLLWLGGSLGFRIYAVNFTDYGATYGTIGGIIVLMLWFYITGLVLIVGAEMNAEMDHAAPWGATDNQATPGQKKKIGLAAARAFREGPSPSPALARPHAASLPAEPTPAERAASYLALFLRWRSRSKR